METHEINWVHELKQNNRIAFEAIYREYHDLLFQLALRYLKDKTLAEDALHDVFLKLWHHREKLNEALSIRGFLFTAMKHHLLNTIRSQKHEMSKNIRLAYQKELISYDTENTIAYIDCQALVKEGISTLSAKKREIIELSLYHGLSHREIATRLNLSEHTVRSQISQSNQLLRSYLRKVVSLLIAFTSMI